MHNHGAGTFFLNGGAIDGTAANRPGLGTGIRCVAAVCEACRQRVGQPNHESTVGIDNGQVKRRTEAVIARVREVTGRVVGDKGLEANGSIDKNVAACLP